MDLGLRQKAEDRVLSSLVSSMQETRSEKEMAAALVGSIFPQDNPCSGKSYPALRRANHLVSSVQDLLFDSPELFYDAIGRNFETHKAAGKSVYERLPRWQVDDIRKDTMEKVDAELKQRSMAFKLQGLSTRVYDGVRGALFHDIDPLSGRHSKHEVCTFHELFNGICFFVYADPHPACSFSQASHWTPCAPKPSAYACKNWSKSRDSSGMKSSMPLRSTCTLP